MDTLTTDAPKPAALNGHHSETEHLNWQTEEYASVLQGNLARMAAAPPREHQDIAGRIFSDIEHYLRRKACKVYIAPFDVRLQHTEGEKKSSVRTVVQPDVCIVGNVQKLDRRGCNGAPDTIIEVLAPGNMNRDVKEKYALYEEYGVPEYWMVSPGEMTVMVYLMGADGRYVLSGEYIQPGDIPVQSLPGFSLQWEEIFEQ